MREIGSITCPEVNAMLCQQRARELPERLAGGLHEADAGV